MTANECRHSPPEPPNRLRRVLGEPLQILRTLALLTLGSLFLAVAIKAVLLPHGFLSSGFTGVSLIAHYLVPALPVSLVYFALNIPVFLLGAKFVSRRFFLYSLVGAALTTGLLQLVNFTLPLNDLLAAAILAGLINGVGGGLILRSMGSAGGMDILSVIFLEKFSLRLGNTYLAADALVMLAGAFLFPLERVLYTLIFLYVNSRIVNLVVSGLSKRKAVFIITSCWSQISEELVRRISGATLVPAEGAYTHQEKRIIYAIVTFREINRLKQIVKTLDPNAIVVISETTEVLGQRIGNQIVR
ncbi:MAG: YitT family protein [Deltaproteobacteria bacterium]|nr:YitT family protein [Deltaproteobacteria bacterium]